MNGDNETFRIEVGSHSDHVEIPSNDMYRRFDPGRRTFEFTVYLGDVAVFRLHGVELEIAGKDGADALATLVERANRHDDLTPLDRDRLAAALVAAWESSWADERSGCGCSACEILRGTHDENLNAWLNEGGART